MRLDCFSSGWVELFGLSFFQLPSARVLRPDGLWAWYSVCSVNRNVMLQPKTICFWLILFIYLFFTFSSPFLHLWLTVAFPLDSRRLSFPSLHILCRISLCPGVRAVACVSAWRTMPSVCLYSDREIALSLLTLSLCITRQSCVCVCEKGDSDYKFVQASFVCI